MSHGMQRKRKGKVIWCKLSRVPFFSASLVKQHALLQCSPSISSPRDGANGRVASAVGLGPGFNHLFQDVQEVIALIELGMLGGCRCLSLLAG
jgi:hypothetical protein